MVGVNMFSLAVLCCVVGPLSVGGSVVGKKGFERPIGKSIASPRIDSDIDELTRVRVEAGSGQSKLFGSCKSLADTALVRFRQINTAAGEQYTRYLPQDILFDFYDVNWVKVTSVPITSFHDCSDFAEQNNKWMFKLDGLSCSVSDTRMMTNFPKCGDSTADAVFVRSSCPEPVVTSLTLTPEATAINVEWTVDDPCSIAEGFKVEWNTGINYVSSPIGRNDRITGLSGCSTTTVRVTPLDSADFQVGTASTKSTTTAEEDASISNVNVKATGIVTFDVTWDLHDPCGLVDYQNLTYDWEAAYYLPPDMEDGTATSATVILDKCDNLQVSVTAYDSSDDQLTSGDSVRGAPLRSTECTDGFMDTCSICIYQSYSEAVTAVDGLNHCTVLNPQSHFLSVASGEELIAAQSFLTDISEGSMPDYYWVNMVLVDDNWVWGSGYVQPDDPYTGGPDWGSGPTSGTCGLMIVSQGYKLHDHPCDGSTYIREMCVYV